MRAWLCELAIVQGLKTLRINKAIPFGLELIYGYTESDEISLLFHPEDNTFGRKVRKINTSLAGEASAVFSLALGMPAAFDCRVVPLPNIDRVQDYFAWRQEDSHRNSLNAHCYWALRKEGITAHRVTSMMTGISVAEKNEMLFARGINYNDLPDWQKRGIGVEYTTVPKEGFDPVKNKTVTVDRRILTVNYDLPVGAEYRDYISGKLTEAT
ncbi:MAG: guanylyltransferase [Clostridia bacterium]|nr:guanylyltransferase [Clostridia bacterium]